MNANALFEMGADTMRRQRLATVAELGGWQEGIDEIPGFWLWHLTRDIPGHPKGSTVTQQTIERAMGWGYGSTDTKFLAGGVEDFKAVEGAPKTS